MKNSIRIFPNSGELAATLADEIVRRISHSANSERNYSLVLSGGSTPELLYSILGDEYSDAIPWDFVQIFWGDERCVPPESTESNFGMAKRLLLDKIDIPESNIHRMMGEEDPLKEAMRYSNEISSLLPSRDGMPVFDLQIMGIGEDGHTASIFPGDLRLFSSSEICAVTVHPATGQNRITLTGSVINNSESVVFLVEGKSKAETIAGIISNEAEASCYPASFVKPVYGSLDWFLDEDGASLL
ncbi:MAG: 6-phosphogluconolactonase [Methanosarcina sp.]